MSTTRWTWWCEMHEITGTDVECHAIYHPHFDPAVDGSPCRIVKRIVIDPDNLPPERVQRAAKALGLTRNSAEVVVRAFLSDPEPGDQT